MKLFGRQGKPFSMVLGIVLISLLLAACGNSGNTGAAPPATTPGSSTGAATGANGKGCTKVGVLLPETASSARWDGVDKPDLTKDIQAIPGVTVDYANAGGDATLQQTQADAALTRGDCILVVAAHDSDKAATIVAKAKQQGVPVIAYDRLIQSPDLNYYVSFDNEKVGELQGQYIADHYKDFIHGSNNNIAMINGGQTDNNAILFRQGALKILQPLVDNKTLNLVYDQYTPDWDNAQARVEMDGVLTKQQNNLQIAYVANDGMANSAIAALKAQKLNGKVLVTGQDATVAGIQNILTGDQSMTIYKPIAKEAQATADLVKALHDGTDTATITNGITVKTKDGTGIPSVLESAIAVDKSNVKETVIADGVVTLADACKGLPAGTDGICP